MAHNILAQFPIVSRADLVYGERCGICHETYWTDVTGSGIVTEDAIRLPCGHEFGFECISTWLSPEQGKNTCPLCRYELWPRALEVEEGHAVMHREWDDMAMELDTELGADGIVHRSRPFQDVSTFQSSSYPSTPQFFSMGNADSRMC